MDWLSDIRTWLSDNEAAISAVAAMIVIGGVILAGLRLLVRRRPETPQETTPVDSGEGHAATDSSTADLDPLTVPGFEGRPAIAVLPFDNLSGDPDQEYFADGIAEDLITRLSSWRRFPVIARNSSFVYRGKAVDVKHVGRELGARYVVEGSVRRSEERVRIAAQLIDSTSGHHVWAETYDRQLQDIFELQDEITRAVVGSMHPELERSEMRRVVREEPQRLDAWDCVMRGWWHWNQFNKDDNILARRFFERAIELDPHSSDAFVGLASSYYDETVHQWTDSLARSIADLTQAAKKSVELDPGDCSAQLSLSDACRLNGQQNEMIAAGRRAVELNPSDSRAYERLGLSLAITNKAEEALECIETAIRLNPSDPMIWWSFQNASLAHFSAKRYDKAVEWARRLVQARPELAANWRMLASPCAHLGRLDEARSALEEALRLQPEYLLANTRANFAAADPEFLERYIDGLRQAGLKE